MNESHPAWRDDVVAASAQRLGVAINASPMRVRSAFRVQALYWHPDHNSDPSAHERFQEVREAYCTLASARERACEFSSASLTTQIRCENCGRDSPSLRPVTVTRLHSRLLFSRTTSAHRILCQQCTPRALLKGSLETGAFGIWSLTGPVVAPLVAWRNAQARGQSRRTDLRIALDPAPRPETPIDNGTGLSWFCLLNLGAVFSAPAVAVILLLCPLG